jgi:Family of unknown function (DUF6311)
MTIPQGSAIRSDAFQGQVALTRYHGKGWLRDEIKNFSGFAFFVIVGIAFATYVLGTRVIDPTNISWLSWDSADAHLGWQFFRNEEYLSLPLGWASSIGYPKGIAIAYFDSIPLIATLLWPFRHWLPTDFQYLGPWWALCAVLQFYFGYRICKHFANDDRGVCIFGGLLFMMAPPFVWRGLEHFALSGHWLILAALDFYLTSSGRLSLRLIAGGAILCFLAGSINPYLSLMTLMLVAAGYLKSLMTRQAANATRGYTGVSRIACGFGFSAAAMLFALLVFGFLRPSDPGVYAGLGYKYYSMNLLAPIDPYQYGSLLLKPQPINEGQYEGYNYFGLGVLLLAAVSLIRRPSTIGIIFRRDALPGWLVVSISLLLALSLKATVGHTVLYDVEVPTAILNLLSAFRSSGRLFWPAFYLLLSGVIGLAVFAFGKRSAYVIFCAVLIQFADLRGLQSTIHDRLSNSTASVFTDDPIWQKATSTYKHLVVIPAWQCGAAKSAGGDAGFWIFGKLAARQRMTLNSFYAGRTSPSETQYFCTDQPSEISRNGLDDDTAYVFNNLSYVLSLNLNDHFCRKLDDVILCAKDPDRRGMDQKLLPDAQVR